MNQELILNSFINYLKTEKSIFDVQISVSEGVIYVKSTLDKCTCSNLPFKDFYKECKANNESAWLFFVEYLNLIADLGQGRNKITELELNKYFTLEILAELFENEELH